MKWYPSREDQNNVKNKDMFYIEGMSLCDKLNFLAEKLGGIRNHLEDIADEMVKEDLMFS